ncbi:Uncharacterized protein TCAP_00410 [Tolypocladium capitatum]|uniref:SH3 domain-containing protein n=1 Tax=Tolypocladium capitatum TaxID=45235 RepID=A0A2K3QQ62_9HYPO|nr:Uncharacterized protein TCAP_00410 [Tolypocladium capitatum]
MPSPTVREATPRRPRGDARRRFVGPESAPSTMRSTALALLTAFPALASAQAGAGCVPLKGSTACPAFQSDFISTSNALIKTYPFLQYVSDTASFDYQLATYVTTSYVKEKYQNLLGCGGINFTDPSNMYARFTTTVLCNTLVQQSFGNCKGPQDALPWPVCADTCAEFAQSEAFVTADKDLCSNPGPDLTKLIRADFTTCALPEGALQGRCISGLDNEPRNCGFGNSTLGLCSYCKAGGANSTDTCCYNANAEKRCDGVPLPNITRTMTFSTPTATGAPTGAAPAGGDNDGGRRLSGGAIAGIVVGVVAGIAILALVLFFCVRTMRRREGSQTDSIFNQPSPARRGPSMSQTKQAPEGYEVLPGGRVARMSALEGHSSGLPMHHGGGGAGAAVAAGPAGFLAGRGKGGAADTQSSSDEFGDSPESEPRGVLRPPPANRRHGSLSSGSLLASDGPQSPTSAGDYSSPLGMASQNSEQLPFFKDYYSQDDIHPADKVAVLWAYQPRAADEFALERGDVLKVVGIWDDGWATGVMLDERAEEWEARRQAQRDSGVSNTSEPRHGSLAASHREMKAFPLVCVCLPEHWKKTIEGDGSTESASAGIPHAQSTPQ